MLRRSFAEFHAQRAQPGRAAELEAGRRQLAAYAGAQWPACVLGCGRADVEAYEALCARADALGAELQVRRLGWWWWWRWWWWWWWGERGIEEAALWRVELFS